MGRMAKNFDERCDFYLEKTNGKAVKPSFWDAMRWFMGSLVRYNLHCYYYT
jgi:hypothetical protein